jgi:hypothetical protein
MHAIIGNQHLCHTIIYPHTVRQSQRLTIHWIYEEPATRAFLARKTPNGDTLFMATCDAVATFYSRQKYKPFLWSAPQPGVDRDREYGVEDNFWARRSRRTKRVNAFNPLLRLPGRTHWLNREAFLKTYNVALLSVPNFTPAQYDLLHTLGLTDIEIDRAMQFDVAYQDMARCNIRPA